MQVKVQETWEPVGCNLNHYEVYLVAEEDIEIKDNQYVMNYAIGQLETGRVEGYAPSLAAAVDTCVMLDHTTEEWHKRKAAESIAEDSVAEIFEVITKDPDAELH